MSIRLDPRRVNALKHLAGEAGVRPGDLVRQWVEERIDGARRGTAAAPSAAPLQDVLARLEELAARVAALESTSGSGAPQPAAADDPDGPTEQAAEAERVTEPAQMGDAHPGAAKRVSAAPKAERVALHDEMIAAIREHGPMSAADLAKAVVDRGRYAVPRSGKPIDAKTVSQRVSNPTYRSRFVRREGRIGLAEESAEES
ncbi:MAG: hypothetical protein LC798_06720 [Chloroflexi bacterium]|nr:hypothetical protein [Chloroflexota bacterium]